MAEEEPNALSTLHQYRLPPPSFDGDYAIFEEWKFKFIAYLGLKHPTFPQPLTRAEASTVVITVAVLTGTAGEEEAAIRLRLASELQFILVSITKFKGSSSNHR